MQNMKLYDLHTGKYLELGTEWGYYGEYIIIMKKPYKLYSSSESALVESSCDRYAFKIQPHTDQLINEIAEKVGAVVYGNRYVLLENEKCGNIYCEQNKWGTVYYLNKNIYSFIPCPEFNPQNDKKQTVARFFSLDNCQDDLIGNIFKSPNKFEELKELMK